MKSIPLILALVLFLLVCVTTPVSAAVVKSGFNAGDGGDGRDGWVSKSPDAPVTWDQTDGIGLPPGCLKITDDSTPDAAVFKAPQKFLGDWTASEYISFNYKRENPIEIPYQQVQLVYIFNGQNQWAFLTYIEATTEWQHFIAPLNESDWVQWVPGGVQPLSWADTLTHITEFFICGDLIINSNYGLAYEVNYLDNVTLALVPEPATVLLLGFGGFALLRKRRA